MKRSEFLNGGNIREAIFQWVTAHYALLEACKELRQAAPHPRDYLAGADDAGYQDDRAEWNTVYDAVNQAMHYCMQEAALLDACANKYAPQRSACDPMNDFSSEVTP